MLASFYALVVFFVDIGLSSYASMTCYTDGSYVNNWDGAFNNIQSSYFLSGVEESVHDNGKEDRRWKFRYCKPTNANPTWTSTFAMGETYWSGESARDCVDTNSHSAIIGGTSYHDDRKEDRLWTWRCGRLDTIKYLLTGCSDTGYTVNTYYRDFSYHCPNNGVIRKITNSDLYGTNTIQRDRMWGFVCCRIQNAPTPSPTPAPTSIPTGSPTPAPTHTPTTAAPSKPGTMRCGDRMVGDYNDEALSFTVQMPFLGDLSFEASNSDFSITSMSAVFFPDIPISGAHVNGKMTLTDVRIIGDYIFTISGDDGVHGTFDVFVTCTSDNPTAAPTVNPTMIPTLDPSHSPSIGPTVIPSIAPSPDPTVSPAKMLIVRPPSDVPTQTTLEMEREVGQETTNHDVIEQSEDTNSANSARDTQQMKHTFSTSWVVIILLFVFLVVCCIITGFLLCRRKKRMAVQTEDTIDDYVMACSVQTAGPGANEASNNVGSTELVSMVTNDGCEEGAQKNIANDDDNKEDTMDSEEEDSDVEDMFLKQKTTEQEEPLTKTTCDNVGYEEKGNESSSSDTDLANDPLYNRKGMSNKGTSK